MKFALKLKAAGRSLTMSVAIYRWDCWTCFKRIQRGDYDRNGWSGPKGHEFALGNKDRR